MGLFACGDDIKETPIDAKQPPTPDAPDVADFSWDEGGESRLEYQEVLTGAGTTNIRTRATTFLFRSKTPKRFEFPLIPGCTKMDLDDRFPLGMGTREYIDYGVASYTGGSETLTMPAGPAMPDGLGRSHTGPWSFHVGMGDGAKYLGAFNALYDLKLSGSTTWPAQTYDDAHYMPPTWALGTPGFAPMVLLADTPITQTYTTPNAPTMKPADGALNMVFALVIPGMGPVVDCIEDTLDGSITVPADMVNHARALGSSGLVARAHVSHRVKELTDGTTHNRKRIDFITIWCYVTPWVSN
ncbi:MAG: hypothetical protein M4D80_07465 [Myxococcota bacterium]|nr:hypothetical protein [Deltaproteobacteria bacterium]MDQ3334982.1 hypothetical protein [Myxococcota bacterium]